jgi:diketogulonate reductase-like aldo/keto reductase
MIDEIGLGVYRADKGSETKEAVLSAIQCGYRHFDTARFYGNEQDVGDAIAESGIPRSEVWITTKLRPQDFGSKNAAAAIKESAGRLGGYIDLLLLHCPSDDRQARHEAYQEMEKAIDLKLVKSIGVSNFGIGHIESLMKVAKVTPACNQIELHPFLQWVDVVAHCNKLGIALVAYSPLVKGLEFDNATIAKLSKKHGVTPAQVLVRWSLNKGECLQTMQLTATTTIGFIALPKSVTAERQRANADVYHINLDGDDMKALDALECHKTTGW